MHFLSCLSEDVLYLKKDYLLFLKKDIIVHLVCFWKFISSISTHTGINKAWTGSWEGQGRETKQN